MWFSSYNSLNFKVHLFKWTKTVASWIFSNNESNFAELFRQQFKRFSYECQLPSRYLNPSSHPTHDNPMDWDLANSLAIRFFPMKPGRFFLIQSLARAADWEAIKLFQLSKLSQRLELCHIWKNMKYVNSKYICLYDLNVSEVTFYVRIAV